MSSSLLLYFLLDDKKVVDQCIWKDYYDENSRSVLHQGLAFTGLVSLILNCWVNIALVSSRLWYDLSYRNLTIFTVVAGVRNVVATLAYLPMFNWFELQIFSCIMFALYETFFAILEVESLNHVCIERFVLARYTANDWLIQKKHYLLYLFSSLFFTTLYTYAPVFGYGGYWYDFTCSSCTFDMILPEGYEKYVILIIFFLRSIKPAIMMVMMLFWAHLLEKRHSNKTSEGQIQFTKNVIVITTVNLLCWMPIAFIRGRILLQQLLVKNILPISSSLYLTFINCAMWLNWLSPALTVIALFIVDTRLRNVMCNLHMCDEQKKNTEETDHTKYQ
ncbi:rhodopsin-like isoform X2 [Galleria mellonella]|uniref:Rhodopsin-like isoform X2 n=1 Tax=Galleria mellonella TaxID=7137 RepID=A0ABM3N4Q8_GALME|nr:rhodopsin-like isoform X2 [Galleria mellonella]